MQSYIKKPEKHQISNLIVQLVKNLPVRQETWLRFQGQKESLEKEVANHSSILAWTGKSGRLQSMGSEESDTT